MAIQYSWNKTINHHDVDGSSMVILCFVGKRRRWVSETKISRGSKLEIWIHQSYYLFSYQDYHCLEIFHHFVSNLDYFFSFFQILTSLFVCEDGGQARLEQFNREWFQILATFLSRNADTGEDRLKIPPCCILYFGQTRKKSQRRFFISQILAANISRMPILKGCILEFWARATGW